MAQDVVGGRAVEEEIRQDEIEEESLAGKFSFAGAEFDRDLLVLGAVDLPRLEPFEVVDGLGEPRPGR